MKEKKIYGYMRVSSRDQNEDRQRDALSSFQIPPKNIFLDKQSGKNFERPAYKQLIRKLKSGDLLIIKSIDRLGRNYSEILEQWRFITKEKGADIKVIDIPLLDTSRDRNLTGTLIADIVLQLLSYVAQTERENIKQRQAEGIAAAKARGVKFGRPSIPIPEEFEFYYKEWKNGIINSRTAAKNLNVSQRTFLNWAKRFEIEGRLYSL